ncbi:hypothetical protein QCA50_005607 [Cerrena zonata]|uniref:Uncharacterized protein n=1 Tax=Cerrena zonata TaxID=2478898 RepID=A0AAW0GFM1_9APHY
MSSFVEHNVLMDFKHYIYIFFCNLQVTAIIRSHAGIKDLCNVIGNTPLDDL